MNGEWLASSLTTRDAMAMAALTGLLASWNGLEVAENQRRVAALAYKFADLMLVESSGVVAEVL